MQPLQFYKYAAGLLLLLNIGVVLFMWMNKPKHPPHRLQYRVIDLLQLDEEQEVKFKGFAKIHSEKALVIDSLQQALLLPYFNSLVDTTISINIDTALHHVQILERQKIEQTYLHFQDVKHLLRPEQQDNYKEIMNLLLNRLFSKMEKRGNRPKPPKR